MHRSQIAACVVAAALAVAGVAGAMSGPVRDAGRRAAAQVLPLRTDRPMDHPEPTPDPSPDPSPDPGPQPAEPNSADQIFANGEGPPVYDRPSYSFGREWAKCSSGPSTGFSPWDGCDPFAEGDADYWHYDKPYGRSAGDFVAYNRWEPGRFQRAGDSYSAGRNYYQSDRWRGPLSWDEGFYFDPQHNCGGYYAKDHRVWIAPQDTPAGTTPGAEQPLPFASNGYGGHGCLP